MGKFIDLFKDAVGAMAGDGVERHLTVVTSADKVELGDRFVDTNGAEYEVERINTKNNIVCIYATTKSNNADGWFTRDTYDVIVKYAADKEGDVNEEKSSVEHKPQTISKAAYEMRYKDRFLDVNGAEYVVESVTTKNGNYCVYAKTESDNADGWFTRDSYDVIVCGETKIEPNLADMEMVERRISSVRAEDIRWHDHFVEDGVEYDVDNVESEFGKAKVHAHAVLGGAEKIFTKLYYDVIR